MFFSTDGTKEAAFTTALLSATIALSIAKACKSKDVTECSCEGVKRPFHGQSLKWRGCSVNIRFGTYSAERFMLSGRGNNSEMNTIMKQNVRVGLEVNTVILRAWLRGGGRPREGEPPASVGWPISPNQFLLECGFLGQPGQVTRLACRYEFSPCFRWDSLHSWGDVHRVFAVSFRLRQSKSPPKQHGCQPIQTWWAFSSIASSKRQKKSYCEKKLMMVELPLKYRSQDIIKAHNWKDAGC